MLYARTERRQRGPTEACEAALARFVELANTGKREIGILDFISQTRFAEAVDSREAVRLGALFTEAGSDKEKHDYHLLYQVVLATCLRRLQSSEAIVMEIGIGSNNPSVPNNMGVYGKPGASLRAFRDIDPRISVIGGDVDKGVLFAEERISTLFSNQLSLASLENFFSSSPRFDVFVDDGFHEFDANLNTLSVAAKYAGFGSWIVIEDIDPSQESLERWLAVGELLSDRFDCWVIRLVHSLVFVAERITPGDSSE